MSRSGYSDDCDGWALIRWRGAVAQAIRGKRGQAFLIETLAALDALPEKRLVANDMEVAGEFCTLGAVAARRGKEAGALNDCDRDYIAHEMGITEALAAEIMFENDEGSSDDWIYVNVVICGPMRHPRDRHERNIRMPNPHAEALRWSRMRAWVAANITGATS